MTECPRLLRSGSPVQRAMLEAAQADAPSASSRDCLLLALGGAAVTIGAAARTASNVGTSSSPTASAPLSSPMASGIGETTASVGASSLAAPAASALAVPATAISTALVAKWLIIATLSLSAVGVGVVIGRAVAQNSPTRQAAALDGRTPSAHGVLSRGGPSETLPSVAGAASAARAAPTLPLPPPNNDLGPIAPEGATHSALSRPNRPLAAEPLTVADETALVQRAREALRRGDPTSCLSLLEIRRKGVRGGVLAPEATILSIDALRALGQRARATQEATRFAHDYPDSPLLGHIRDLIETSEP
jgi:hypothetical protein